MVRQGAVIFFSGGDTDMEPLTGMSDTTLRFACMVLLALRACRLSEAGCFLTTTADNVGQPLLHKDLFLCLYYFPALRAPLLK